MRLEEISSWAISVLEVFADFLFAPDPEAVKSLSVKVMPAGHDYRLVVVRKYRD